MNMISGTALAVQQDTLLKKYLEGQEVSQSDIKSLEGNLWVASARALAPSNLVVRQYALIDLLKGTAGHRAKIEDVLGDLTEDGVYLEGYSYYEYTMNVLRPWIAKFPDQSGYIQSFVNRAEGSFVKTAYLRGKVWYPAPYGDLRNEPLRADLQKDHEPKNILCGRVWMDVYPDRVVYKIRGGALGMNLHVQADDSEVSVRGGFPMNFKFYEGYDKKYPSKTAELADMLRWKRISSLFK